MLRARCYGWASRAATNTAASPPALAAVEDQREVAPDGRVGIQRKASLDPAQDRVELAMIDPVHEDHPSVRALRGRPLAQDRREVADVVGDEDPLLGGCRREHLFVVEPLERRLLIKRTNLVPIGLEPPADTRSRDVRVEQQPQR